MEYASKLEDWLASRPGRCTSERKRTYPLHIRLGGSKIQCGRFGEDKQAIVPAGN